MLAHTDAMNHRGYCSGGSRGSAGADATEAALVDEAVSAAEAARVAEATGAAEAARAAEIAAAVESGARVTGEAGRPVVMDFSSPPVVEARGSWFERPAADVVSNLTTGVVMTIFERWRGSWRGSRRRR